MLFYSNKNKNNIHILNFISNNDIILIFKDILKAKNYLLNQKYL